MQAPFYRSGSLKNEFARVSEETNTPHLCSADSEQTAYRYQSTTQEFLAWYDSILSEYL